MLISMSRVGKVFGDRILVRRLQRPEKIGGILIPANYMKNTPAENEVWWGVVEAFGLDSRYGEAYRIKVGDVVGLESLATNNQAFDGDDGEVHAWIMEEFVACKDDGRQAAFREGKEFKAKRNGLIPVGPYSLVKPHPEEQKRNGITLPQNTKQAIRTGEVLDVSAGQLRGSDLVPMYAKKGTEVIVGKYSGSWAKFGEDKLLLVKDEDIIAELQPAHEAAHA